MISIDKFCLHKKNAFVLQKLVSSDLVNRSTEFLAKIFRYGFSRQSKSVVCIFAVIFEFNQFCFFSLTIFQRICVRHRYRSSVQNSRNHQIELITSVSVFSWTYFWKKYSNPFVVDVVWNRIGFFHFSQFFICVGTWTIRNHKSNLFAAPRNGYAVA